MRPSCGPECGGTCCLCDSQATPLQSETRVDFWAICCPAKRAAGDSVKARTGLTLAFASTISGAAERTHKARHLGSPRPYRGLCYPLCLYIYVPQEHSSSESWRLLYGTVSGLWEVARQGQVRRWFLSSLICRLASRGLLMLSSLHLFSPLLLSFPRCEQIPPCVSLPEAAAPVPAPLCQVEAMVRPRGPRGEAASSEGPTFATARAISRSGLVAFAIAAWSSIQAGSRTSSRPEPASATVVGFQGSIKFLFRLESPPPGSKDSLGRSPKIRTVWIKTGIC